MLNIFILNWDSAVSVQKCITNVLKSDDKNFRIILINNFSTGSDLIEIRNIYDTLKEIVEIYLIENNENLGYAGGNNSGLNFLFSKNLTGNILILNPDILISKNTISEMKKALEGNVGIVTVRTINTKGEILFDAIHLKGFFQYNVISNQEVISTDYSQGSCMLIKREIIEQIGLFDERFYLYWEELDFSLRVKRLGNQLISTTKTFITKNTNCDSRQPAAFYYSVRNAKLLKEKHGAIFTNSAYFSYLFRMFLITFKFAFKPQLYLKVILNYFSAIHDSFLNKYYSKPK